MTLFYLNDNSVALLTFFERSKSSFSKLWLAFFFILKLERSLDFLPSSLVLVSLHTDLGTRISESSNRTTTTLNTSPAKRCVSTELWLITKTCHDICSTGATSLTSNSSHFRAATTPITSARHATSIEQPGKCVRRSLASSRGVCHFLIVSYARSSGDLEI